MSEGIILLDFVLVNMEAVRERGKTTVTVRSSPPRPPRGLSLDYFRIANQLPSDEAIPGL